MLFYFFSFLSQIKFFVQILLYKILNMICSTTITRQTPIGTKKNSKPFILCLSGILRGFSGKTIPQRNAKKNTKWHKER